MSKGTEFEWNQSYIGKALLSDDMQQMIRRKAKLGALLYKHRVKYDHNRRPGDMRPHLRDAINQRVAVSGAKRDRWVGLIYTDSTVSVPHTVAHEFGHDIDRSDLRHKYRNKETAEYFKRGINDRGVARIKGQHTLGGNNRKIQSVVRSLEEM